MTEAPAPRFEQSLAELEKLVERMERGDLQLDDALASFERGMALVRDCDEALTQAELRVRTLLGEADESAGKP